MKLSLLILAMISFSAFASFNEVECEGTQGNKEIFVQVEQPFPSGSTFQRTILTVTEGSEFKEYRYTVSAHRNAGFKNIRYWSGGLNLDVDYWPDNAPRWGRNYRSTLKSEKIDNYTSFRVECRFPNAF